MTNAGTILLEPIMELEVVTVEESASAVLADLSGRRAEIQSITARGKNKVFTYLRIIYINA